jgi:hypothetical protein
MWLLLSTLALAHPVGGALPGHRLRMDLSEGELRVHQWTRVPIHHVLDTLEPSADFGPEAADAFVDRKHMELAQELVVSVDGQVQSWRIDPDSRSSKGTDVFLFFEQDLLIDLEPGPHTIAIRNGNLPDLPGFFWVEGELSPDWVLLETEPLLPSGWSMDESLREVSLSLRPMGKLESLRPAAERRSFADGRVPPVPSAWWILSFLGLILGLGSALFFRRRQT